MDWTKPVAVNLNAAPTALEALTIFIGHYDCRVYLTDRAWLDVGAGSLGAFARIANLPEDHIGSIGAVGRFCEINDTATIHAGGNHDHDKPINVSLKTLGMLRPGVALTGLKSAAGVSIGNGVVISAGARILPGANVGDGSVVGADSLVTCDVAAYQIVGGVPAAPLRRRAPAQPWWDFSTAYMLENFDRLQDLASGDGPHPWRKERPRFVVRWRPGELQVQGFTHGETVVPLNEAPQQVQDYLAQAFGPHDQRYWLADCWA
jgi:acetyltransferase-like isoleucine patch superfamily enzyme